MVEPDDFGDYDLEKAIDPPPLPPVVDKLGNDGSDLGLTYQCGNLMILRKPLILHFHQWLINLVMMN